MTTTVPPPTESPRERARQRIEARRNLLSHAVVYVVVNSFLVGVWLITGRGYFWPAWVLAGWGVGLVMHVWDVYGRRPVTDEDIEAELARRRPRT